MPRIELNHKEIESLSRVRDLISDENNAFSMEDYTWDNQMHPPSDSHRGTCGTPACICGWSRTLPASHRRNIRDIDITFDNQLFNPSFKVDGEWQNWKDTFYYFTRSKTIRVLDHLIETGKLDWSL